MISLEEWLDDDGSAHELPVDDLPPERKQHKFCLPTAADEANGDEETWGGARCAVTGAASSRGEQGSQPAVAYVRPGLQQGS